MSYSHHWVSGQSVPWALSKIVCVGRNYAEHAKELNNPIPSEPLLFIKPSTCAAELEQAIQLPAVDEAVHYETELALLIGERVCKAQPQQCASAIAGIGLALDLTLRQRQSELKAKGHPWELAKAFDGACPLSRWLPGEQIGDLQALTLSLSINGQLRQSGDTGHMLTPCLSLVSAISQHFTLLPGDVVITGTPAGVGQLAAGDKLELSLNNGQLQIATEVIGG